MAPITPPPYQTPSLGESEPDKQHLSSTLQHIATGPNITNRNILIIFHVMVFCNLHYIIQKNEKKCFEIPGQ